MRTIGSYSTDCELDGIPKIKVIYQRLVMDKYYG